MFNALPPWLFFSNVTLNFKLNLLCTTEPFLCLATSHARLGRAGFYSPRRRAGPGSTRLVAGPGRAGPHLTTKSRARAGSGHFLSRSGRAGPEKAGPCSALFRGLY